MPSKRPASADEAIFDLYMRVTRIETKINIVTGAAVVIATLGTVNFFKAWFGV